MILILENGAVFHGMSFGAAKPVTGEVVFTTGMTGYLETLTDPSYAGQIVMQTFPLIGNYGVIPEDFESKSIAPRGYICKSVSAHPSNFRCKDKLAAFLARENVVGLCGIDTRAVTRIIREQGTMNGRIQADLPTEADFAEIRAYRIRDAVAAVSTREVFCENPEGKTTIAVLDYGIKSNMIRCLAKRGCKVVVFPHDTPPGGIAALNPDGIFLSNGPGDPADNLAVIENLRGIADLGVPIFGICLGHQLLALAHGAKTHKLKYGHRGANQPVKDLATGRVYITSQNHGYAVKGNSLPRDTATESFINANDGTCEGVRYTAKPAFSVQFHPEACGGPRDTEFLFDNFLSGIDNK